MNVKNLAKRLWDEEEGGEAVEYGLIIAVIAVVLIGALVLFRKDIEKLFSDSGSEIADPDTE